MITLTAALWSKPHIDEYQAVNAWKNGMDFKIMPDGPYCSIRDSESLVKLYASVYLTYGAGDLVRVL